MRPTVHDIAETAGVSLATVDRVLNRRPGVKAATRERVEAAIRKIGFVRDMAAANLAKGRTYPLVFVVPRGDNSFMEGLKAEIEAAIARAPQERTEIAIRDVPRFGYVLPMREQGAELITLPLRADARPSPDVELTYDATAGVHLPVPFALKVRYSGAYAEQSRENLGGANDDKLNELAEQLAKTWTGSTTIVDPTVAYDAEAASLTIGVEGLAYPDWYYRDGRLELEAEPILRVVFDPDRSTSAWRRLPALIEKPWTARTRKVLVLPGEGEAAVIEGTETVQLSLPAVSYQRTITRQGARIVEDVISRESGAEVPGEDVSTTRKAVADANATTLRIAMPAAYPHRWDAVSSARNSRELARIRDVFDKRIAEKPDDATRLSDRAWLEERLLDWASAEKLYGKAIALAPSSGLYLARSNVRSMLGNREGSLADAQAAYDLDPGDSDVRGTLASALSEMDETDDALDLLDPSPDVASEDGEASLLSRADILMRGGRYEESIELLDAALTRRSTSPELLNSRCWIKALSNIDLAGALADCTRAIELSAEPAAYFDSRAMVHFRSGRMDQALADLDSALLLAPELAPTRFMRGVIASREGNRKGGSADLDAARKLNPAIDAFFARYGIKP